jgi:uncharacterized protein YciI
MFVILLHYKKPLSEVDRFLVSHREFLQTGYDKNIFIVSGPREPRIGGVILSQLSNRDELESWISRDPFYINQIADYEVIEFNAVKHHPNFSCFIN